MKKINKIIAFCAQSILFFLFSTKNALANMPAPDPWYKPDNPVNPDPIKLFGIFDLQYMIVGIFVLAIVTISSIVLFKIIKKQ